MTITLTEADVIALSQVYERARDDWEHYEASGHGPTDFETPALWRAHARRVNDGLIRVSWILDKLPGSLVAGPDLSASHTPARRGE